MNTIADDILKEALHLPARERAALVEDLLSSLDHPDSDMDKLWAEEAERRIEAANRGVMGKVPAERVFEKYEHS